MKLHGIISQKTTVVVLTDHENIEPYQRTFDWRTCLTVYLNFYHAHILWFMMCHVYLTVSCVVGTYFNS